MDFMQRSQPCCKRRNADSNAGGNAYNQRAVLAGYEKNDLQAIYYYVRSLAVASAPFLIAKENLRQQFELVRQSHQRLSSEQPAPGAARSLHGRKLVDLTRSVEIGFLHLQGKSPIPALPSQTSMLGSCIDLSEMIRGDSYKTLPVDFSSLLPVRICL